MDIAFRIIVFPFLALLPVAVLRLYRMFQARRRLKRSSERVRYSLQDEEKPLLCPSRER